MRAVAGAVAAVALVATAAPLPRAQAAPSPLRWRMWRVVREGTAARPLDMMVTVTPAAMDALSFVVGVRTTGGTRRTIQSLFYEHGETYPFAYHDGTTAQTCPTSDCARGGGGDVYLPLHSSTPIKDEYLVVTWAGAARITAKGWRVREVAAPRVRRVLARTTGATGVYASAATVEHFTGATAPGGARGSIAYTSLPCADGGLGKGTLDTQPAVRGATRSLDCAGDTHSSALAGRAVRWTVRADVVGWTSSATVTRLLVVDLPA